MNENEQETNENKQKNQGKNKEKNDPIPEWLHERAEALAKGMFRGDKELRDKGKDNE